MLTSRLSGPMPVTSAPCSRTWPRVGCSNPAIMRSVVVLPQPDGPSREKNSPSRIVRLTPRTAAKCSLWERKVFSIPISSIAGDPDAPPPLAAAGSVCSR